VRLRLLLTCLFALVLPVGVVACGDDSSDSAPLTFEQVESNLEDAGYKVSVIPQDYGIYEQSGPGGQDYRIDDALNIELDPDGQYFVGSVYFIADQQNRDEFITSYEPDAREVVDDAVFAVASSDAEFLPPLVEAATGD
jgi:hypothetical protein